MKFPTDQLFNVESWNSKADNETLNNLGKIPVVSTFTGSIRILAGLVHAVKHAVQGAFHSIKNYSPRTMYAPINSHNHWEQAKEGLRNCGRGAVEVVPLLGNAIICIYDRVHSRHALA